MCIGKRYIIFGFNRKYLSWWSQLEVYTEYNRMCLNVVRLWCRHEFCQVKRFLLNTIMKTRLRHECIVILHWWMQSWTKTSALSLHRDLFNMFWIRRYTISMLIAYFRSRINDDVIRSLILNDDMHELSIHIWSFFFSYFCIWFVW